MTVSNYDSNENADYEPSKSEDSNEQIHHDITSTIIFQWNFTIVNICWKKSWIELTGKTCKLVMFQRFFSILHYCKTWSHITVSNESQNVLKGTSVGRYSDSLVPIPTPPLSHTFWTLWKSAIRSCKPNSTLRHVYRQSIGHISCFSMLKKSVIRSCNTPRSSSPHPHNI